MGVGTGGGGAERAAAPSPLKLYRGRCPPVFAAITQKLVK